MIKLFVTGDNHIGKKYDTYPDIRAHLIQSRFDCLEGMVREAERQGCELFVVTGDLFDNIDKVAKRDVRQTVEILARFDGTVLVLPGNHDYYTGDEQGWHYFMDALAECSHNVVLLNEFREYSFEIGEETVVVYPAFCPSKHSGENTLGWIKEKEIVQKGQYNIGVAHGALKGITPDLKEEYFLMTEAELSKIPMDVWLVGHTHIPYPELKEQEETAGYRIFNAGTHEQTDLHNNTEGNCFIITVDKAEAVAKVLAHRFTSGRIRYFDLVLELKESGKDALRKGLSGLVKGLPECAVVRIKISGRITGAEYEEKEKIYQEILGRFLSYRYVDHCLSREITVEQIRAEFSELSFAAQFMEKLMDNPMELQMAYQLLQDCKE